MPVAQGVDSSSIVRPLLVDTSGRALVANPTAADLAVTATLAPASTVTVIQATAGSLLAGMLSHDGAVWRRQPLVWGYTDRYAEQVIVANGAAGSNTLSGTAVPSGEVWVINAISLQDANSIATTALAILNMGGTQYVVHSQANPPANGWSVVTGAFVLKAGDYVQGFFSGVTLNDDLTLDIVGYKMGVSL